MDQFPANHPEFIEISAPDEQQQINQMALQKHRKLLKSGQFWVCGGLFLMGASFAINLALFHTETSFTSLMYVLTTMGMVCLVKGLANIFGF